VRRDNGVKAPIPLDGIGTVVTMLLDTIQHEMYTRAKAIFDSRLKTVTNWTDFIPTLDGKNVVVMPWCEDEICEDDIKERSGRV